MLESIGAIGKKIFQNSLGLARHKGQIEFCHCTRISGWAIDKNNPQQPVSVKIEFMGREEVILANLNLPTSTGPAGHGFSFHFPESFRQGSEQQVKVSILSTDYELTGSPAVIKNDAFIDFIALDVTNNCNLRCPFCMYDYSETKKSNFMTAETFSKVLQLMPYTSDAVGLWLSCFHEPTIHKQFEQFIEMIPEKYRQKVFFTSNLTTQISDSLIQTIANSNFYNINISLDTLNPDLFPKLRKGGRINIFLENLTRLTKALKNNPRAPKVRFITLAFESNASEIVELVKRCANEFNAWEHEVRGMFSFSHIAGDFKDQHLLKLESFTELERQLKASQCRYHLVPPPTNAYYDEADDFYNQWVPEARYDSKKTSTVATPPSRPLQLRVTWDGNVRILQRREEFEPLKKNFDVNINMLTNPADFFKSL